MIKILQNDLRSHGTPVAESDLKEVLREVKLALLEADVNYKIVKEFISVIEEKALGQDVIKSLTPGQQVVKIVKDEKEGHKGTGSFDNGNGKTFNFNAAYE